MTRWAHLNGSLPEQLKEEARLNDFIRRVRTNDPELVNEVGGPFLACVNALDVLTRDPNRFDEIAEIELIAGIITKASQISDPHLKDFMGGLIRTQIPHGLLETATQLIQERHDALVAD